MRRLLIPGFFLAVLAFAATVALPSAGTISAAKSTVVVSPSSVPADGKTAAIVTVTARDLNGNPLGGKTIRLDVIDQSFAGGSNAASASPPNALTNAAGAASFSITSNRGGMISYEAIDVSDQSAQIGTARLAFNGPARSTSTVKANPDTLAADGSSACIITVTLRDKNDYPLPGRTITLDLISQSFSGGENSAALSPENAVTDSSGTATFSVKAGSSGKISYMATDSDESFQVGPVQITFTTTAASVSPTNSTVRALPDTLLADGSTNGKVIVTLKNASGDPVAGRVVRLRSAVLVTAAKIEPTTGVSDATGVVTFSVGSTRPQQKTDFYAEDVTDLHHPLMIGVTYVDFVPSATPAPLPTQTPGPLPTPTPAPVSNGPVTCIPRTDDLIDEQIGKTFCFAGVNLTVDSIQTVNQADSSPLLKDIQVDPGMGYIVVRVTMQNRSASRPQNFPGNFLGFDLADGSSIDLRYADAEFAGTAYSDTPSAISPGRTVQVTYVVVDWNHSPITTMYLKRNVGDDQNDIGVQYARFRIAQL